MNIGTGSHRDTHTCAVGVTAAIIVTGSGPATAHSASPAQVSVQTAGTASGGTGEPAKGALRIRITGLPTGVRPQVRISGPGRYRKTVKRTGTLKRLTPGVYRVATPRVSTPAGKATGRPSKRRVKVKAGRTVRVAAELRVDRHDPPQRHRRPTGPPAPDTTPPGTVTALTAGDRTPDSIALSWTNPTDADLAAVIVRRAKGATAPATPTDGTGMTLPGAPTATGVTDTGLDPDTTYSYAVFTRDTTGNTSAPATLTTATTSEPQGLLGLQLPEVGTARPGHQNQVGATAGSGPVRGAGQRLVLHHLPRLSGGGRPHRRARPRCDRTGGP